MRFTAYLIPVAKARARVCVVKGFARAYTPRKTADAEQHIRAAFLEAKGEKIPKGIAINLVVQIYRPRPSSLPKKKVHAVSRPDIDNYVKLVLDALNKYAWDDDGQVTILCASKKFGEPPRIEVDIEEIDAK